MDDTELVVEVAMDDNQREIEHIQQHLESFDVVWIACPNQAVIDGLRERLAEQGRNLESVTFHAFQYFCEAAQQRSADFGGFDQLEE